MRLRSRTTLPEWFGCVQTLTVLRFRVSCAASAALTVPRLRVVGEGFDRCGR